MKNIHQRVFATLAILNLLAGIALAQEITPPPEELDLDPFYKKCLMCNGMPITSSENVADEALFRSCEVISKMIQDRPDMIKEFETSGRRFTIIGAYERTSEIPEHGRGKRGAEATAFMDLRARGYGGRMTSSGEENIMNMAMDRYHDESILIHEFAHAIHGVLRQIDPSFQAKLEKCYEDAMGKGLCQNDYASTNASEYWAEAVQSYYDANRENNWNHNHINTREELIEYDPEIYKLVKEILNHTEETDWRYKPLVKQPAVIAPPEHLGISDAFPKYSYCRNLPLLGTSKVSDEAILEAHRILYNMFRYRHDIWIPYIDTGAYCIVLGDGESIEEIPRNPHLKFPGIHPDLELEGIWYPAQDLIASEANLLHTAEDPSPGESLLIRDAAMMSYVTTAMRPVDPSYEDGSRRQSMQQFEVRLTRIDVRFNDKLLAAFREAMDKDLWENTLASRDLLNYWAEGVQSFFDANAESEDGEPDGVHNHVNTREELVEYDPTLAALIREVFKHPDRYDWRYEQDKESGAVDVKVEE